MNKITLAKFLARYYNITNDNLSKITHDDVQKLIPSAKRCSFDYVDKHLEEAAIGNIVLAIDSKGKMIPYIVPKYDLGMNGTDNIYMEVTKAIKKIDVSDLSKLTNYELTQALQQETRVSVLKNIKNELKNRNIKKNKHYKIERENSRVREQLDDYEGKRHGKY